MARAADLPEEAAPPGEAAASATLGERLRRLRLRLVMDPRFQRFAARFPLTRRHAARRADDLFRLTAGFVYSQVLHSAVELDLFRMLAERPMSLREIAGRTGLAPDKAERLIDGCVALDLLSRDRSGRLWPSDLGAVLAANDGIRAMIAHHAMLYRDLDRPLDLLSGAKSETETAAFWSYAGRDHDGHPVDTGDANGRAYSELMAASQDLVAGEILDAFRFAPSSTVLDIGGGDGTFLRALGARVPDARLWLFDLPEVAALARERFASCGLAARSDAFGGDFFTDDLPEGADCVTLVRVLCDHDDAAVMRLLQNIRRAMRPGATLVIGEPMAGDTGSEALVSAYFGFYFLAMGQGRCRTPEAHIALLSKAGFARVRRQKTRSPLFSSVIVASA